MSIKDIDETEFLDLYNKGFNDTEIAIFLVNTRHNIGKMRKKLNLPLLKAGKDIRLSKNKIIELINEGKTDAEIARELNLKNGKTIGYFRKINNIPANWVKRKYNNKTDRRKGLMLRNIKFSAYARKLDFNLTYEDLLLPEYCPILGVKLTYGSNMNSEHGATVDRIDTNKGYIKGNIIIMSRKANAMKSNCNLDNLLIFCKNINKLIDYYKTQGALGSITDVFPDTTWYEET